MRIVLSGLLTAGSLLHGQMPSAAGDSQAVAAAERLLQRVGGREVWARRTLVVEERSFLRSGGIATLRIARDFVAGTRSLASRSPGNNAAEWLSPDGGWESRNGAMRIMPPAELAAERQGLRQEPYAIYHRIARRDSTLRFALRDSASTLVVYDGVERVLCWFVLDGTGAPTSWGNFYDGRINQHYYGPLQQFGAVSLPRWGVSTTGQFRFEYVTAILAETPVAPPPP